MDEQKKISSPSITTPISPPLRLLPQGMRQIDTPDDNNCLFWSAALGLLIPLVQEETDKDRFRAMYERLFGTSGVITLKDGTTILEIGTESTREGIRAALKTYDFSKNDTLRFVGNPLYYLIAEVFRQRVVDKLSEIFSTPEQKSAIIVENGCVDWKAYLTKMKKTGSWGGQPEIRVIAHLAGVNVTVYGSGGYSQTCTVTGAQETLYLVHVNATGKSHAENHYHYGVADTIYAAHLKKEVKPTLGVSDDKQKIASSTTPASSDPVKSQQTSGSSQVSSTTPSATTSTTATSPLSSISTSPLILTDKTRVLSKTELHEQVRGILQRLLPHYQHQWDASVRPLQRHTSPLTLSDFQAACQTRQQLMPLWVWLNPQQAQAADRALLQACMERQSEMLTEIQALAKLSQPTSIQQQTLQAWQQTLHHLLSQWSEAGYHTWVMSWQMTLRQQLPPIVVIDDIPLPEDNGLAMLAKGLATPLTTPDVSPVWEQAHAALLQCLTRYAMQRQWSAFLQAKRRYMVRLRSYQLFCEKLSITHPVYTTLSVWCQNHLAELRSLTPVALMTAQSPPSPELWSIPQDFAEKPTLGLLQSLCAHLPQQLILPPPCPFEVVLMQSSTVTAEWCLHILVTKSAHCQDDYFVAYQHLFQLHANLLPAKQVTMTIVNISTPQNLASSYCPLWPSAQTEVAVPAYTPLWHQYYPAVFDQPHTALFTAFIRCLMQRLTQVFSQGQAEEKAICQQHHALATQPLVESKERALQLEDPSLADPAVMLKKRQQAHRAIRKLWRIQKIHYAPVIDLLVSVAITFPVVIQGCLKGELEDVENSVYQDERQFKRFDAEDEKAIPSDTEKKSTDTTIVVASDDHYLRLYRRIPRLWKSRYIQQLIHYWQQTDVTIDFVPTITVPKSTETHQPLKEDKEQKKNTSSRTTASLKLTPIQQQCLNRLSEDADETGWCYQQEKIATRWQQLLRALLRTDKSGYPPVRCRFAENGRIRQGYLRARIAAQLLDNKKPVSGQWRSKAKGIGGRHQVFRVVIPAGKDKPEQALWFKLNPEQPGTEYLVQQIDQRLGGFATPPQQLMKITVADQPSIPVLISQEAASPTLKPEEDQNLARVLVHHPEWLKKLSPLSFVSTLLRVLVINPEDDKANDYFLVPDPDKPGYYRLLRIDNERAFFSPEQAHEGWTISYELNVKTIIFCLDQMQLSWDELVKEDTRLLDYKQQIQRLVPAECFQAILREASDLHDQWCRLFSCEEVITAAQTGLKQGEIVFPVMLVLPDYEKALLERLYLIQQAWHSSGVSGLSLLDSVHPRLADYYRSLFKPGSTPQLRFEQGPGKLYKRDLKGQLHTTVSGVTSLSRQLNLPVILKLSSDPKRQQTLLADLIQQVWQRQQYSAAQALYGVGLWQQEKILQIEHNLLALPGDLIREKKTMRASVSPTTRDKTDSRRLTVTEADALRHSAQLQFQLLSITDRTALIKRMTRLFAAGEPRELTARRMIAEAILTLLTQAAVIRLSLTAFCEILSDQKLIAILHRAGRQLLSLDISQCTLLTPRILQTIAMECPNIYRFRARHLDWKNVIIERWLQLKTLDLSHSHIHTLTLNELPQLIHLKLKQCKSLSALGNVSRLTKYIITPYNLPKLKRLDISHCIALIEIKLLTQHLRQLKCHWEDCHPQILVDWAQLLYKDQIIDASLFDRIKTALASVEKLLDLLESPLNGRSLEALSLLLKWNIPINYLVIPEKNLKKIYSYDDLLEVYKKKPKPVKKIYRSNEYDYILKIVLRGDPSSGKTSLLDRFVDNIFSPSYSLRTTIGVDCKIKTIVIQDLTFKFQIWDTSGQNRFEIIIKPYYRGAHVILICFDLTDLRSWQEVPNFLKSASQDALIDVIIILVGTKSDLISERVISRKTAQAYADERDLHYFECSAQTGEGVDELFHYTALATVLNRNPAGLPDLDEKPSKKFSYNNLVKSLIPALQHNHHLLSIQFDSIILRKADKAAIEQLLARNRSAAKATETLPESKSDHQQEGIIVPALALQPPVASDTSILLPPDSKTRLDQESALSTQGTVMMEKLAAEKIEIIAKTTSAVENTTSIGLPRVSDIKGEEDSLLGLQPSSPASIVFRPEALPEIKISLTGQPLPIEEHVSYAVKHKACLEALHTQSQQPLTDSHWPSLLATLAELESILSESAASENIAENQRIADKSKTPNTLDSKSSNKPSTIPMLPSELFTSSMIEERKYIPDSTAVLELITFCQWIASHESMVFADCIRTLTQRNLAGHAYLIFPTSSTLFSIFTTLIQLAAEAGLAEAQYMFAVWLHSGKLRLPDVEQAFLWYQQAAEQGHIGALYQLGRFYETGYQTPDWHIPVNLEYAIQFYQLAAEAGDAAAQVRLGRCYEQGQGIAPDVEQAYRWYQAAAAQGDPLGAFHAKYLTKETNLEDAAVTFRAYQLAAEAGNLLAHYYLGRCYETGRGVAINLADALRCFQIAASGHYSKAQAAYQRLLAVLAFSTSSVLAIVILESGEFKKTGRKKIKFGGQGALYQDHWHDEIVAVKHLHRPTDQKAVPIDKLRRQIQHLEEAKTNRSDYLMQVKALCLKPPCLVLEYLPGNNLTDFLRTHPDITWPSRYRLAHDIIQGLAYLHEHRLLHRDLKNDNIMVMERPRLHTKLCDFDSLKKEQADETGVTSSNITFFDPELFDSLWQSQPALESHISYAWYHDMYNLGWVLLGIAGGIKPFLSILRHGILYTPKDERLIDMIPKNCPQDFAQLIRDCWSYPSAKRPRAAALAQRITALLQIEQETLANKPDEKGHTPLMQAIGQGEIGKVDTLLAGKASVNQSDSRGWTPLFWAVQRGKQASRMTQLLLEAKADPAAVGPKQSLSVLEAANYQARRHQHWVPLYHLLSTPTLNPIAQPDTTTHTIEKVQRHSSKK